jgi:hypothetical protein
LASFPRYRILKILMAICELEVYLRFHFCCIYGGIATDNDAQNIAERPAQEHLYGSPLGRLTLAQREPSREEGMKTQVDYLT